MTAKQWQTKLKKALKMAQIDIIKSNVTIKLLAETLERRDNVREQFDNEGAQIMVDVTSDRGAVNRKINPLLKTEEDLTALALTYINALGLSPTALKKIKGDTPQTTLDPLTALLNQLENNNN